MEAARHLHAVDAQTGEVLPGGCPDCPTKDLKVQDLEDKLTGATKKLIAASGQVTRLSRELAQMRVEDDDAYHDDILSVLSFWRPLHMPNAEIVEATPRWERVRDRLKDKSTESKQLVWTVQRLKGAVVGMSLDPWTMDRQHPHRRDIVNAFRNSDRVHQYFVLVVGFRRETGTSALELLDDLAGDRLAWLADRCSCGETRVAHLMGRTECETFDEFEADQWRWLRRQDGQA